MLSNLTLDETRNRPAVGGLCSSRNFSSVPPDFSESMSQLSPAISTASLEKSTVVGSSQLFPTVARSPDRMPSSPPSMVETDGGSSPSPAAETSSPRSTGRAMSRPPPASSPSSRSAWDDAGRSVARPSPSPAGLKALPLLNGGHETGGGKRLSRSLFNGIIETSMQRARAVLDNAIARSPLKTTGTNEPWPSEHHQWVTFESALPPLDSYTGHDVGPASQLYQGTAPTPLVATAMTRAPSASTTPTTTTTIKLPPSTGGVAAPAPWEPADKLPSWALTRDTGASQEDAMAPRGEFEARPDVGCRGQGGIGDPPVATTVPLGKIEARPDMGCRGMGGTTPPGDIRGMDGTISPGDIGDTKHNNLSPGDSGAFVRIAHEDVVARPDRDRQGGEGFALPVAVEPVPDGGFTAHPDGDCQGLGGDRTSYPGRTEVRTRFGIRRRSGDCRSRELQERHGQRPEVRCSHDFRCG